MATAIRYAQTETPARPAATGLLSGLALSLTIATAVFAFALALIH
ncbi:MAG TPA: hypothetical protein VIO94_06265 [Phenylobacterium sp.]